jgi:hypothetical protein
MSETTSDKIWKIIDEYIENYRKGVEKFGFYWKVGIFYRGSTNISIGESGERVGV